MTNVSLKTKQIVKNWMTTHRFTRDFATRIAYFHNSGRILNLRNPKTWSEKLLWMNKYWQPELKSICADKYAVRDFVKEKGLENILLPLYGVWDDANRIDFGVLPNRFVLKCNHGCGWNIICEDKSKLDISQSIKKLNYWMSLDLGETTTERHYHFIQPRIICEGFLPVEDYHDVVDYKIHCFQGNPEFIGVCYDRNIMTQNSKGAIMSTEWKRMFYLKDDDVNDVTDIPKPKTLEKMVNIARILSSGIPYVRIDLYSVDESVFFGEMTFTPDGNILDREYTWETVCEMGKLIELPEKILR